MRYSGRTLNALFSMATLIVAAPLLGTACSDDDDAEVRQGRRGESCRAANDCIEGLNCISQRCVQNDFPTALTARQCVAVECTANTDCFEAELPAADCSQRLMSCQNGDPLACSLYLQQCAPNRECISERCVPFAPCFEDFDCLAAQTCVAGRCTAPVCTNDEQCGLGLVCVDGACVAGCSARSDCPYLNDCVNRQCVAVGCATNRECIALTQDPTSQCITTGEGTPQCRTPCDFDVECNDPLFGCVEGVCTYLGCETDEECRVYLRVPPGADVEAVCR